ncbi:MAG: tyrosine-type recombinase/integrase [Acidobacteriia bacterium]|nr:tyrosine-type recombinase/integrase [Terriglobia bacterium]
MRRCLVYVSERQPSYQYTLLSAIRQIARDAGLPDHESHPHVLKHALATHLVRRDVNLAKVQLALRHRSINSTMVYVGVSDQEADSARHNALMNAF